MGTKEKGSTLYTVKRGGTGDTSAANLWEVNVAPEAMGMTGLMLPPRAIAGSVVLWQQSLCWCPWSMLPPKAMGTSLVQAGHVNVWGLCWAPSISLPDVVLRRVHLTHHLGNEKELATPSTKQCGRAGLDSWLGKTSLLTNSTTTQAQIQGSSRQVVQVVRGLVLHSQSISFFLYCFDKIFWQKWLELWIGINSLR